MGTQAGSNLGFIALVEGPYQLLETKHWSLHGRSPAHPNTNQGTGTDDLMMW